MPFGLFRLSLPFECADDQGQPYFCDGDQCDICECCDMHCECED